jgi:hypothetical protein
MLSHLYRLAASFRRMHGFLPNRLYLNHGHYRALRANLPELRTQADVARFARFPGRRAFTRAGSCGMIRRLRGAAPRGPQPGEVGFWRRKNTSRWKGWSSRPSPTPCSA